MFMVYKPYLILFVFFVVSMEINNTHYFQSDLHRQPCLNLLSLPLYLKSIILPPKEGNLLPSQLLNNTWHIYVWNRLPYIQDFHIDRKKNTKHDSHGAS